MLVVFSPIFVTDTKIIFRYNFVAPLMNYKLDFAVWSGCSLKFSIHEKSPGNEWSFLKILLLYHLVCCTT